MNQPTIETIPCPSCGQRYSVELSDSEQDLTCSVCHSQFTVAKITDPKPTAPSIKFSVTPPATQPLHSDKNNSGDSSSTINQKQKINLLDRFMALLFRFGKSFASLLAVLCLLATVASLAVFTWNLHTSMKIPTYSDISPTASNGQASESNNTQQLDERRALEKKYGDQVASLVKNHQFDQTDYDPLMSMVASVEEKSRQKFLNGLEKALKQRDQAAESNPKEVLAAQDTAMRYRMAFSRAESEYESKKITAKSTRWFALGATFVLLHALPHAHRPRFAED
jgi:hypothetical protein